MTWRVAQFICGWCSVVGRLHDFLPLTKGADFAQSSGSIVIRHNEATVWVPFQPICMMQRLDEAMPRTQLPLDNVVADVLLMVQVHNNLIASEWANIRTIRTILRIPRSRIGIVQLILRFCQKQFICYFGGRVVA